MKSLISRIIDEIPDYDRFYTTSEMDESSKRLASEYPDKASVFEIGKSASGRVLNCLKIGSGKKTILFLGCPHPNEPIGAMMTEYLTEKLLTDSDLLEAFDYTWYFVKSWDIDGTTLNEGWFNGPFGIENYAKNFYRPAPDQQVEWTFPIKYKNYEFNACISETRAVKDLMDKIRPDLIYSLHNSGFGGAYWYITDDMPELYEDFYGFAKQKGIPLQLGEPEVPYGKLYSDAIFNMIDTADEYDYLEKYSNDPPETKLKAGSSSAYYGKQVSNAVSIITELPYFYDERIVCQDKTDSIRRDLIIAAMEFSKKNDEYTRRMLDKARPYVDKQCRFYRALDAFSSFDMQDATIKLVQEESKYAQRATVAEEFDNTIVNRFYSLLSHGMMVRMHEEALKNAKTSKAKSVLNQGLVEARGKFKDLNSWLEEKMNYRVIPIRDLIAIQLGTGLTVAHRVSQV